MKKKLIISIILVVVLCASIFTMAACKKGLSTEALDDILAQLKYQLKNKEQITSVPGVMTWLDDKDNEFECYIKWEVVGTDKVTVGKMDDSGLCAVTIPAAREQDISYTLKATLVDKTGKAYTAKDGSAFVAEFAQSLAKTGYGAMARQAFRDITVGNPVAGTNYKLAFYLGNRYEVYYATGAMDRTYLATDTDRAKAANATIETTTNGFYIKLGDKYVSLNASYNAKGNPTAKPVLTDTASTVFTVGENNILLGTATCAASGSTPASDAVFVLGTYGTQYTTIAASSDFYVTKDNAYKVDTEQWVCRLCTDTAIQLPEYTKPTEPAAIIAAVEDLPAGDYLPGGTYTLTGTVTEVTDTSSLTGTNPVISLNMTVDGKKIVCYQMKSAIDVPVGSEIKVTGYLFHYKKDADTDAVVEFAAGASYLMLNASIESSVDKVATPAEETAYRLTMDSAQNLTQYYLLNAMGDGNQQYYVKTTTDVLSGVDFYVEAVTGGYKIYWLDGTTKKYVGAKYNATDKKTNLVLNVADAELVWTIDADGIHMTLNEKEVYIGTVDTYTNAGVYEAADNLWKAYLGTIKEEKTNATITVEEDAHATVKLSKETAKVGDEVTITVTTKDGYTIGAVKVNGEALTAESEGVYKFTVKTNSVVTLTLVAPSGEAPEGSELNPYTAEQANTYGLTLGDKAYDTKETWATGYVVDTCTYNSTYKSYSFWIADTATDTKLVQVYSATLADGINAISLGDKVVVKGTLQNYVNNSGVHTIEYTGNTNNNVAYPVIVGVSERADASIEYVAADNEGVTITITGAEGAKLEGKSGDAVTFTVVVADGYKEDSLVVKVNGSTVTANNGTYTVYLSGTMTITTEVLGNDEDPKGTATNPYTVAEAIDVANALEKNGFTETEVYVKGIVVSSPADVNPTNDYGKTFEIASTLNGTRFIIYGLKYTGDITALYIGDEVILHGHLKNQNGNTPEMASGKVDGTNYVYPGVAEIIARGDASITVNTASSENAIVAFNPAAAENGFVTGKNGDVVVITVAAKTNYIITAVYIDGKQIGTTAGDYTVTLESSMTVIVNAREEGAAVPVELYTTDFARGKMSASVSNYASATDWTITNGAFSIALTNFANNNKGWDSAKVGGKNNTQTGYITIGTIDSNKKASATAVVEKVTAVTVSIKKIAACGNNSDIWLEVSTTADFAEVTKFSTTAKVNANNSNVTEAVFNIDEKTQGAGLYYRVVFVAHNNTTGTNGVYEVNGITLTGYAANNED